MTQRTPRSYTPSSKKGDGSHGRKQQQFQYPNPQNDFDLDAALEEKFQQVQQDLDRLRAMNANADAQQAAVSAAVPSEESTEETATPEEPLPETEPAEEPPAADSAPTEDAPQFEIAEEALSETAPAANTPEDKESARERKARYKLKRQILITNRVGAVVRIFAIGSIIFGGSIFLLVGNRPTESAEENRKLATPPSFHGHTGKRRLHRRLDALLRGHRSRSQQLQAYDKQTGKLPGLAG
ncbi:MAG: hypothetical protein ACLT3Y_05820 [Ruminococcus callidus]